jgi:ribosomal protein L11 methyltransferase
VLVDVDEVLADAASGILFDLGANGLEERDATTLAKGAAGKVTLVASFEDEDAARVALESVPVEWSPRPEVIVGDAFRDEWKKFFHPFELSPGIVVRPPWEAYESPPGKTERVLELEPGRAFGTGLHETTSLVADALVARQGELEGARVLDVGCGSGILSLLALVLGAKEATSVDIDPEAVAMTRENAVRNGLAGKLEASTTDVRELRGAYGVVLANIEARVLVPLADAIMARTAPGGLLVLSGVLAPDVVPQLEEVKAAYAAFTLESVPRKGEWVAILLRAPR